MTDFDQDTEIRSAYEKIKGLAKAFAEDVPLIPYEDFTWYEVNANETVMSKSNVTTENHTVLTVA